MHVSFSQIRGALCVLLVAAIPFGTRKLIHLFTKGFDEYEAVFLYGTDIILAVLVVMCVASRGSLRRAVPLRWLAPFVAVAGLSIIWSFHPLLATYAFFRFVFAALFAFAIAASVSSADWYRRVCVALMISGVFQSLVGITQFITGKSVGLRLLGESQLGPTTAGVARVATEYGRMLRAYGTMPHANIYAYFIMLALVSALWLWVSSSVSAMRSRTMRIATHVAWGLGIFVLVSGLTVSFSRSGWLSAAAACLVLFAGALVVSPLRSRVALVALSLALCVGASYQLFNFAINPRIAMTTTADYSISARITYNKLAVSLVESRPLGVGIGNQVLYSVKNELYQKGGMTRVWEWQPIHNIYLLIASETGILGVLAFLVFFAALAVSGIGMVWRRRVMPTSVPLVHATALLLGGLVFGLADHFPWDLQLGRLMLWCVVGLMCAALYLARPENAETVGSLPQSNG
jgi:O-antigen ligase